MAIPGGSLAQGLQDKAEFNVLSLELTVPNDYGEAVPRAHFFIEPETGAWGAAGGWAYWEPEGGWYLYHDAAGIYRAWLLTGQEQMITSVPEGASIGCAAVSPDGQWVAFATITEPHNLTVYAVRSDGSEQRLLMHVGYMDRVWDFGWSEDGQSVEFDMQPAYYNVSSFSVRLDGSTITAKGDWYHISPDSQWIPGRASASADM